MPAPLTPDEKRTLLILARQALELSVRGDAQPPLDVKNLSPSLRSNGVCFVTLTINGELRGCIGALEAYQSLVEDVREHTIAAARDDYRFPPVGTAELNRIQIEISRLTQPSSLDYETPDDLLGKLRPHVDGVLLRDGARRATFLPQVWEQIPRAADFLDRLCEKMGASANLWRKKHLQVFTYQVEEFHEA